MTLTDDIILDTTAHFFTRFLRFKHRLFQCQLRETDAVKLQTTTSEWVSSFLTAHQHIIGYSVPYNGLENAIKDGKYNQGYLATIKYE